MRSTDSSTFTTVWGKVADAVAAGDYDGDGRRDPAVMRIPENKCSEASRQ